MHIMYYTKPTHNTSTSTFPHQLIPHGTRTWNELAFKKKHECYEDTCQETLFSTELTLTAQREP